MKITMRSVARIVLFMALFLTACTSASTESQPEAAAHPMEEPVEVVPTNTSEPTATLEPTSTPTDPPEPTVTPEPTATATPEPQPQKITGDNAAQLTYQEMVEIPRKPNLQWPYVLFSPDSQKMVVQTEAGIEILKADTMEFEASYSSLNVHGFLADGRLYGKQIGRLVFVDLASGEVESIELEANFSGVYVVSPQANKLAYVENDNAIQVIDLVSGAVNSIGIKTADRLNKLIFSGDGSVLLAWWQWEYPHAHYIAYDATAGTWLYEQPTNRVGPKLLAGGEHFAYEPQGNSLSIRTFADNKEITSAPMSISAGGSLFFGYTYADNGAALAGRYWSREGMAILSVDVEAAVGEAVIFFPDIGPEPELVFAPDAAAFLVIWPDDRLELRQRATGDVLAETDRYAMGSKLALSPDGTQVAWSTFHSVNVFDWQTGQFTFQVESEALPTNVGRVSFVGESTLAVEMVDSFYNEEGWPTRLLQVDLWNLDSGDINTSFNYLNACDSQDEGQYLRCALYKDTGELAATRLFLLSNPNIIPISDNTETIFMVGSPTANSVAYCEASSNSIAVKAELAPLSRLAYPCQSFFYDPAGEYLYLQDGAVVRIASGEKVLQLAVDDTGKAFESEFIGPFLPIIMHLQLEDHNGQPPQYLFGDGFIVINNRVFEASSGALLVELTGSISVQGITFSENGKSLLLLTNRGLERWQVVQ